MPKWGSGPLYYVPLGTAEPGSSSLFDPHKMLGKYCKHMPLSQGIKSFFPMENACDALSSLIVTDLFFLKNSAPFVFAPPPPPRKYVPPPLVKVSFCDYVKIT